MKLYHTPSPNPQKITFALFELALDCEIIPVDFTKGDQRSLAFLALNPFGKVPVLVDGDLVLWDSHAILAYLVVCNAEIGNDQAPAQRSRQPPPNLPLVRGGIKSDTTIAVTGH
jgi:glutathione S-transferase